MCKAILPRLLFAVLVLTMGCHVGSVFAASPPSAIRTSSDLIEEAYRSRQIDYETRLVQLVLAQCRPQRVQPRFQTVGGRRVRQCATNIFHEVNANWRRLSRKAQQILYPIVRRRPTDSNGPIFYTQPELQNLQAFDSPGGFFRIHYTTTGFDAPNLTSTMIPGVPDFVVQVANAFDTARATEVNTFGYRPPPTDFPAPPGFTDGGSSRYDVYLADIVISLGAIGAEIAERPAPGSDKLSVSFILFDNDFVNTGFAGTPLDLMRITAAHEFHHGIQDGYDTDDVRECFDPNISSFWFYEATSSWIENQVFPQLPHFYTQRLPRWFARFNEPLDLWTTNDPDLLDHSNGSSIYMYYLSDTFGRDIIRQIWETLAVDRVPDVDWHTATDATLQTRGSNFATGFLDFVTFNYITNTRDDGQHYSDGALYPLLSIPSNQVHSSYPVQTPSLTLAPKHLAGNYAEFRHQGAQANEPTLSVLFDGQDSGSWVARLLLVRDTNPPTYVSRNLTLDALGRGTITINDFNTFNRAILVVGTTSLCEVPPSQQPPPFLYSYNGFLGEPPGEQTRTVNFNVLPGATVWNMISNPLTLPSDDPTSVFGNPITIANYAPQQPAIAPNQMMNGFIFVQNYTSPPPPAEPLRFRRGRGFFLRTTNAGPFSATGTIPDPFLPVDIPLNNNDWTLIGNPFADAMPWNLDQISHTVNGSPRGTLRSILGAAGRAVEPFAWHWNAQQAQYELVFDAAIIPGVRGNLLPGEAVFFRSNTSNVTVNLTNPTVLSSSVLRPSRTVATQSGIAQNEHGWSIELKAFAGGARDQGTLLGRTSHALFSRGIQVDAPPLIPTGPGRVTVGFAGASGRPLKADIRGMNGDRDSWDVFVNTDVPNADVTLTWPNLVRLPKSQRLILIDADTGKRTAMRTSTQYTFRSNSGGPTTRRFVIQLTPASSSGIRFSTVQVSTIGARVHLSYALNREADVRLRVLNAAGKVINALPPVLARSGLNTITWDGKAQGGLAISRGIYLMELTARSDEGEETRALKSVTIR